MRGKDELRDFKKLTIQNTCGHYPETDEEKWTKPLDSWCEECNMVCCRVCFENDHKNHKYTPSHFTKEDLDTHRKDTSELLKRRKDDLVKSGALKER